MTRDWELKFPMIANLENTEDDRPFPFPTYAIKFRLELGDGGRGIYDLRDVSFVSVGIPSIDAVLSLN